MELARAIFASLAGLIGWQLGRRYSWKRGLGLNLIGSDAGSQGIVGAPLWAAPFVQLPFTQLGVWLPGAAAFLIVAACIAAGWVVSRDNWRKSAAVLIPVAIAYAAAFSLGGPFGTSLDILISLLLGLACVAAFAYLGFPWRYTLFVIFVPLIATLVYCLLFLPVLKVDALLTNILPEGVQVASSGNAVPLNFLVAGGILLLTGCLAVVVWYAVERRCLAGLRHNIRLNLGNPLSPPFSPILPGSSAARGREWGTGLPSRTWPAATSPGITTWWACRFTNSCPYDFRRGGCRGIH